MASNNNNDNNKSNKNCANKIRRGSNQKVSDIVDELIVFSEVGRNSCYSMQFNLNNSEVEQK